MEGVQKAYTAIEENPYDLDAWNILIQQLTSRKIDEVRQLFEKLVKIFPTTGRYWKIYIEQEVRNRSSFWNIYVNILLLGHRWIQFGDFED